MHEGLEHWLAVNNLPFVSSIGHAGCYYHLQVLSWSQECSIIVFFKYASLPLVWSKTYKMATLSPEGKQCYLCLPWTDKNLCCSRTTNTFKVSSLDGYQSPTDLWLAGLSRWLVIERPHTWADMADYRAVNTFLGRATGSNRAVTRECLCLFLCAPTQKMKSSQTEQITALLDWWLKCSHWGKKAFVWNMCRCLKVQILCDCSLNIKMLLSLLVHW